MDALEFQMQSLKSQIESGPFSESFEITRENEKEIIRGIYDESILKNDVKRTTQKVPRIIVFSPPDYESGVTEISVRGNLYKIKSHETDANLKTVLNLL